ncbi:MAG: transaldolase [Chloroflexota bacterium]
MSNNSTKTFQLGQSLWYDNIQRKLLENGDMAAMVANGEIYGVTSNPSIFHNAIGKSKDYDAALIPLAKAGKNAVEIYETLAVDDIQQAADLFQELYIKSEKVDGYVSLEVNPDLANNTAETISEAKRLWALVDRPNLMIKIPATKAGIPAVSAVIAAGINVNVTLIFSLERYQAVMDAYLTGLEERLSAGEPIDGIASVASFFISRVDTNVDNKLAAQIKTGKLDQTAAASLFGKAALANAKLAYQEFKTVFEDQRFSELKAKGAQLQRPLWASTSTKNPDYPDVLYIDELIGPDTVNTVPPNTLVQFNDHGNVALSLETGLPDAGQVFADLEAAGVSIDQVTEELEEAGVQAFSDAFHALLETVETRRQAEV